jgi:hypothetical protein
MLAVAYATGRASHARQPDRSRVMTQTKRDNLVLQVGGLAWGQQPHTVRNLLLQKSNKVKSCMDLMMMERVGDG